MPKRSDVAEEFAEDEAPETEPEEISEIEVDQLFAENSPEVEVLFRVKGVPKDRSPSRAVLRKVPGGVEARWRDSLGTFTRDGEFTPNRADSEKVILMNTVIALQVYFVAKDGGVNEMKLPPMGTAREQLYEKMDTALRNLLLDRCYEVNGFMAPF